MNGKHRHLGSFPTPEEASAAYQGAVIQKKNGTLREHLERNHAPVWLCDPVLSLWSGVMTLYTQSHVHAPTQSQGSSATGSTDCSGLAVL